MKEFFLVNQFAFLVNRTLFSMDVRTPRGQLRSGLTERGSGVFCVKGVEPKEVLRKAHPLAFFAGVRDRWANSRLGMGGFGVAAKAAHALGTPLSGE